MISKDAPSGVSEHLVVAALEKLEKEECRVVLIGPVPAKELGKIIGLGKIITRLAELAYKAIKKYAASMVMRYSGKNSSQI